MPHARNTKGGCPFRPQACRQASHSAYVVEAQRVRSSTQAEWRALRVCPWRIVDILLHRRCIVDEMLKRNSRVIRYVVNVGMIDMQELMESLRWRLGGSDDGNLELFLRWSRDRVPLQQMRPLHIYVLGECQLRSHGGGWSTHVDGHVAGVCGVTFGDACNGHLCFMGIGRGSAVAAAPASVF